MNKSAILIGIVCIILLGGFLFISKRAAITPQELRNKAAVQNGIASVLLTPSSRSFYKGSRAAVTLTANIPIGKKIDGFQVVIDITGTNTSVTFQPAPIAGIKIVRSDIVTRPYLGKRFTLMYISSNPLSPYLGSGLVTLGNFTIIPSADGSMTLSFNSTLTKITENMSTQDIVNIPKNAVYTFTTIPPTPTPIRYFPTPTPIRYYPTPTRYIYPSPTRRIYPPPTIYHPPSLPTPVRYYPM